jgi:ATP/maltotriose-dependent transcriptional regulator MalT
VGPGPRWAALHEFEGGGPLSLVANVPLPPKGTVDRRLLLWRHDGSDFTDRDVLLLTFLRPHLVELHRRQRAAMAPAAEPCLTPRQWEVLRLVAEGRSNTQIAHVLVLSEATVRKHLENIYERLAVNSRTEALAKALPSRP